MHVGGAACICSSSGRQPLGCPPVGAPPLHPLAACCVLPAPPVCLPVQLSVCPALPSPTVQEVEEAVELPLPHPELYEDIGIKPPKVAAGAGVGQGTG